MTSIIKVDQIQNAAGGVPTAADLGLNVSGAVLDHYYMQYGISTSLSSQTYTDSNLTLTVTPKSATSKFIISYNTFFYLPNNGATWAAAFGRIMRDSTAIRTDEYTLGRGASYQSAQMKITSDTYVDAPNTTSSITYKVQFASYTGTIYMHYSSQKGFLSITEIAG